MDAKDLLTDLDQAQIEAVTTPSLLVAVIAGAGSGKTRVLTRRVAYRIATETADPEHTLVLTFTRDAAGELKRRLPAVGSGRQVTAGTFHSVCRRLLQQHWEDNGERPPTLRSDRERLLAGLAAEGVLGSDTDSRRDGWRSTIAEIDVAASRGWSAEQYQDAVRRGLHRPGGDLAAAVGAIEAYASAKRKRNLIDLDDLLKLTVDLLEYNTDFANVVRWRFRHILVDEAQDLNPLQHRLIKLLTAERDDLYLVGDPDQAIYGFNGSDSDLLVNVGDHFPGIEVLRLPTNHRSTPQVVEAGLWTLRDTGAASTPSSGRDHGPTVRISQTTDEEAQAATVADSIAAIDPSLIRSGEVAVLARTHAVLKPVRVALAERGVPVRFDADGTGSAFAPHLRQVYRLSTPEKVRAWVQDHIEVAQQTDDEPLGAVTQTVLAFLREHPQGAGVEFENWVDNNNPFGQRASGVELTTFHAAKGREWHTVHLVGVETSLVPHRSARTVAAQAEEARLLYVAITRATDQLTIDWCERRDGYQRKLSPLLEGFESVAPATVAPPPNLTRTRSAKDEHRRALERWRDQVARSSAILPSQVLTDAQLARLAADPPTSAEHLGETLGIGKISASALFPGIRAAVSGSGDA